MRIAIIGSTQYTDKFKELKETLQADGNTVMTPAFDKDPEMSALEILTYNRDMIEWADVVYVIWDARSPGTIFDFGMVFMARKPLKIHYIESKTFEKAMREYERAEDK